jgi:hypothetical protein
MPVDLAAAARRGKTEFVFPAKSFARDSGIPIRVLPGIPRHPFRAEFQAIGRFYSLPANGANDRESDSPQRH